tara:strand:- start:798 stop:1499 length:702 start_codon:yes stop_codon:yes gene_type:complete
MKTSVIIPCFNEEKNLETLFSSWMKAIEGKEIEVIFVNNGSSDNSKIVLDELKNIYKLKSNHFKILDLENNKGYGGGIQEGLNIANGNILCWCHADNQISVEDVVNIIQYYSDNKNSDILLKGRRKNRPTFDKFFTYFMSILVKITTGIKLTDINAQPKVFYKDFYSKDREYSKDFLFDLDFLLSVKKNNKNIIEKDVNNLNREFGEAKGGGSLKGKIYLSLRTISYLLQYKK